jgi:hypothetical protein
MRTSGSVPDVPDVPDVPEIVRASGRDDAAPSATVPADRPADPAASAPPAPAPGGPGHPGGLVAPADVRTVAHLIPAARAARATLAETGLSMSRDHLADVMRDAGHGVSNGRASLLLKILKAEQDMTTIGPTTAAPGSGCAGTPVGDGGLERPRDGPASGGWSVQHEGHRPKIGCPLRGGLVSLDQTPHLWLPR